MDPVVKHYESPYACFANSPIWFSDRFGLDTTIDGGTLDPVVVLSTTRTIFYRTGDVSQNSQDDDLSKKFHNVEFPFFGINPNNGSNKIQRNLDWFRNSFTAGTQLESLQAQREASSLITHFETGRGSNGPVFGKGSSMSGILSEDDQFIEMATLFEYSLINHLKRGGGFNGFNGNDVLRIARQGKYIKDTWFMHTVMGGFQQVDAEIKVVSATQLRIRYTLWDHFGAGTNDAGSLLPGLPSLYWLQHNSARVNVLMSQLFTPFIWGITAERTISR